MAFNLKNLLGKKDGGAKSAGEAPWYPSEILKNGEKSDADADLQKRLERRADERLLESVIATLGEDQRHSEDDFFASQTGFRQSGGMPQSGAPGIFDLVAHEESLHSDEQILAERDKRWAESRGADGIFSADAEECSKICSLLERLAGMAEFLDEKRRVDFYGGALAEKIACLLLVLKRRCGEIDDEAYCAEIFGKLAELKAGGRFAGEAEKNDSAALLQKMVDCIEREDLFLKAQRKFYNETAEG